MLGAEVVSLQVSVLHKDDEWERFEERRMARGTCFQVVLLVAVV